MAKKTSTKKQVKAETKPAVKKTETVETKNTAVKEKEEVKVKEAPIERIPALTPTLTLQLNGESITVTLFKTVGRTYSYRNEPLGVYLHIER